MQVIQVPADARLAVLVTASGFLGAGLILLWAYFSGTGSHRSPRAPRLHHHDPPAPRRARLESALLTGELPPGADYPTQPLTAHDTREMKRP
jgi:hypothetical protein